MDGQGARRERMMAIWQESAGNRAAPEEGYRDAAAAVIALRNLTRRTLAAARNAMKGMVMNGWIKVVAAVIGIVGGNAMITNMIVDGLKDQIVGVNDRIDETNRRMEAGFAETNRRIDETNQRIDETNDRIDETNRRMEAGFAETNRRIDETNRRIDETNVRIDETNDRIDETNRRMEAGFTEMNGRLIADSAETNTRLIVLETDLLQTGRAVARLEGAEAAGGGSGRGRAPRPAEGEPGVTAP